MRRYLAIFGILIVSIVIIGRLTAERRTQMRQQCVAMMEQMPDW